MEIEEYITGSPQGGVEDFQQLVEEFSRVAISVEARGQRTAFSPAEQDQLTVVVGEGELPWELAVTQGRQSARTSAYDSRPSWGPLALGLAGGCLGLTGTVAAVINNNPALFDASLAFSTADVLAVLLYYGTPGKRGNS